MTKLFLCMVLLLTSVIAHGGPVHPDVVKKRPKLIVVIVIDQFRADYLTRFQSRFLPATKGRKLGGFRYLMEKGAYFPLAEYNVMQAMTAVGHAALMTGAYPYRNGIALNSWFDQKAGQRLYCVSDKRYKVVGAKADHAYAGSSPVALMGPTLGDAMKNAGLSTRVLSVGIKNRAAILMGGHRADLAVWFESGDFAWASSTYYLPDGNILPWMNQLNTSLARRKGEKQTWQSKGPGTGLSDDGRPSFTRVEELGTKDSLSGPMGVQMTVDAAIAGLKAHKLGKGKHPDLLAVSFSTHDLLGHQVGPNRREMEELTVLEDKAISQLLNAVAARVPGGLSQVAVVLTGDHGIPPMPEYLKNRAMASGRIDQDVLRKTLNDGLTKRLGKLKKGDYVPYITNFNVYLNRPGIKGAGVSLVDAENAAKAILMGTEGIAHVFTRTEHSNGHLPPGLYGRQAANSYYPGRSGDVVALPRAFYVKGYSGKGKYSVSHVTGYSYDRTVPLLIAGPRIRAGVYANRVELIDVAPTLSVMAGVVPPALSEGRVLHEIFEPAPAGK